MANDNRDEYYDAEAAPGVSHLAPETRSVIAKKPGYPVMRYDITPAVLSLEEIAAGAFEADPRG